MDNVEMKAYEVTEPNDGCGTICFANDSEAACLVGAITLGVELEAIESCVRKPEFDQYAPGPVPAKALIAAGWQFECHHCGREVMEARDEDEEDDPDYVSEDVVEVGRRVYCGQTCCAIDHAERRAKRAAEAALIELVESLFPGATASKVHVYRHKLEPSMPNEGVRCSADFTFPGARHKATYIYGKPEVLVAREDVDAFRRVFGGSIHA